MKGEAKSSREIYQRCTKETEDGQEDSDTHSSNGTRNIIVQSSNDKMLSRTATMTNGPSIGGQESLEYYKMNF